MEDLDFDSLHTPELALALADGEGIDLPETVSTTWETVADIIASLQIASPLFFQQMIFLLLALKMQKQET